jgi:UDP-N-acetylmuramoylalanine-D-glutamate ligase
MYFKRHIYKVVATLLALILSKKINQRCKFLVFTGTVGKTTMRDTVSYVLKEFGLTVRSSNLGYTNELGIVLSIFGI